MADPFILVGTNKGLIVYSISPDRNFRSHASHFLGYAVTMTYIDERNGRWWVGLSHKHWGQKLHFSDDQGSSWQETAVPAYDDQKLPDGSKAMLRQMWCMSHGGKDQAEVLWLGTEPGGLFKSTNGGQSFDLVASLWNHPSHMEKNQWFGAGSDVPFIHTILVDPRDSAHVYVAVSCAGVFETTNGGQSWHPKNNGLRATYLPNPKVEVGHDPHRLIMCKTNPEIIWQQNHCGIFNTRDGGTNWKDVSVADGLPHYGFAIAVDQSNPDQTWVIPVQSDAQRIAPDLQLQVFKTMDFGASWHSDSDGLPLKDCFDIVLRHSFAVHENVFIFGTTNGNLYGRTSASARWELLLNTLTKVNYITID